MTTVILLDPRADTVMPRRVTPRAPRVGNIDRQGSARRAGAPIRLTVRGRVVVVLLALACVAVALVALVGAPATASTPASLGAHSAVADRVVVQPGQTLWQLAQDAVPGADPRATIQRIKEMNGLSSSDIEAGRVLLVPRR